MVYIHDLKSEETKTYIKNKLVHILQAKKYTIWSASQGGQFRDIG